MKTMPEIYRRRLEKAIEILRNLELPASAKFNMGNWGIHERGDRSPEELNNCGTSACALGWLSLNNEMQAEGLKGTWRQGFDEWNLTIEHEGKFFLDAAYEFFGISNSAALHAFGSLLNTKEEVADLLEVILNRQGSIGDASETLDAPPLDTPRWAIGS